MSEACALCRRRSATAVGVGEDWLCRACLAAIGRFFRECPEDVRSQIWSSPLGDLVEHLL